MEKKFFSKLGLMYFIGIILFYGAQIGAIVIGGAVAPMYMADGNIATLVSMMAAYFIAVPIIVLLIKRVPVAEEAFEKKKMSVGQWITAFVMSYSLVYISNMIGTIVTFVIGILKESPVENDIMNLTMQLNLPTTILIMVIGAPIVEEFLFRKLLIDRASRYGEGLAVVLSGAMFGLFHGNLNQFAYTFIMGCFYGFIYVRTRNVIYPILLHMLNNFMASVLAMFVLEKSGYMELAAQMATAGAEEIVDLVMANIGGIALYFGYCIFIIVLVIVGVILLITKRKKFYVNHTPEELPKGKRFTTVFFNLGMILFSGLMLFQIISQLLA